MISSVEVDNDEYLRRLDGREGPFAFAFVTGLILSSHRLTKLTPPRQTNGYVLRPGMLQPSLKAFP